MTFLSPLGAFAALFAALPLAVLAFSVRRAERAARTLGLTPPRRRVHLAALALAGGACLCAGVAAAQPALRRSEHRQVRSQSEVLYIVDVSRSMAAGTRFAQARAAVRKLRAAAPDVPSGLAGLTDRVLPYIFPTADAGAFDATLQRSVKIESPRPQQVSRNATSFAALSRLGGTGFFGQGARTRTCVLVTDGEARSLPGRLPCRLLVVRVGSAADRIAGEPAYVADPAASSKIRALAAATGGRAFADAAAAAGELRVAAEVGPLVQAPSRTARYGLAPWLALIALALTLALAAVRVDLRSLRGATVPDYTRHVVPS
jgi:hypothetical protein